MKKNNYSDGPGLTKEQWGKLAIAALQNATGCSPSTAHHLLEQAGGNWKDCEDAEAVTPTQADWQEAFESGGIRLFTESQSA